MIRWKRIAAAVTISLATTEPAITQSQGDGVLAELVTSLTLGGTLWALRMASACSRFAGESFKSLMTPWNHERSISGA